MTTTGEFQVAHERDVRITYLDTYADLKKVTGETTRNERIRKLQQALGSEMTIVGLNATTGGHSALTDDEVETFRKGVKSTVTRLFEQLRGPVADQTDTTPHLVIVGNGSEQARRPREGTEQTSSMPISISSWPSTVGRRSTEFDSLKSGALIMGVTSEHSRRPATSPRT